MPRFIESLFLFALVALFLSPQAGSQLFAAPGNKPDMPKGTIARPFEVVIWNVEESGFDPEEVADQLSELPKATIYALQGVALADVELFGRSIRASHGNPYRWLAGWTGGGRHIMVAYDADQLRLRRSTEFYTHFSEHRLNDDLHRSPLMCTFVDTTTRRSFNLIVVHLARDDHKLRNEQLGGLGEIHFWATEPTLLIGDFGFDCALGQCPTNDGFRQLTRFDLWQWSQPEAAVNTTGRDPAGDGRGNDQSSYSTFVFHSKCPRHLPMARFRNNPPYTTVVKAKVLIDPNDLPANRMTGDNQAVIANVEKMEYRLGPY